MKSLVVLLIVFVLGFVLGAGAGFKVLEGISTNLVMDAFRNSSTAFVQAYSGSAAQGRVAGYEAKLNAIIEEQKAQVAEEIKKGILEYVKSKLGMGTGN